MDQNNHHQNETFGNVDSLCGEPRLVVSLRFYRDELLGHVVYYIHNYGHLTHDSFCASDAEREGMKRSMWRILVAVRNILRLAERIILSPDFLQHDYDHDLSDDWGEIVNKAWATYGSLYRGMESCILNVESITYDDEVDHGHLDLVRRLGNNIARMGVSTYSGLENLQYWYGPSHYIYY